MRTVRHERAGVVRAALGGVGDDRAAPVAGAPPRRLSAVRPVVVCTVAVCAVIVGCSDDAGDTGGPPADTDVRITSDRDGRGGAPAATARIRCDPGATSARCRAVRELPAAALRPVPRDAICTEIYGGPATGRIRGVIEGARVDGRFARTNGCEIARFDRVAHVLRLAR
jgi:hypothetical protein